MPIGSSALPAHHIAVAHQRAVDFAEHDGGTEHVGGIHPDHQRILEDIKGREVGRAQLGGGLPYQPHFKSSVDKMGLGCHLSKNRATA